MHSSRSNKRQTTTTRNNMNRKTRNIPMGQAKHKPSIQLESKYNCSQCCPFSKTKSKKAKSIVIIEWEGGREWEWEWEWGEKCNWPHSSLYCHIEQAAFVRRPMLTFADCYALADVIDSSPDCELFKLYNSNDWTRWTVALSLRLILLSDEHFMFVTNS